ncbi:MAG: hypothetical protein ACE5I7_17130 [Candidatus Binatia bacterium]
MKVQKMIGTVASTAAVVLLTLSPAPAKTGLDKCAKAIDKEGSKLQAAIAKAFGKCEAAFQKDVAKGVGNLSKAAPACEKQLSKVFPLGGKTKMQKALDKLNGLIGKSCTDINIQQQGHLSSTIFGDRWAKFVIVNALEGAFEQEIATARLFLTHMQNMSPPPLGRAPAGACPTCQTFTVAPCFEHSCNFLSSSNSKAVLGTNTPVNLGVSLVGVSTFKLCKVPGVTPDGEFLVSAAPGTLFEPAALTGLGFGCNVVVGAEGVINCSGTAPSVDYTTCADHNVGAPDSNECTEPVCFPDTADCGLNGAGDIATGTCASTGPGFHTGVVNGGVCTGITQQPSTSGGAFIGLTTQINVVQFSELGPDGKPCTADDIAIPGAPSATNLTTGTVNTKILDADNLDGVTLNACNAVAGISCTSFGSLTGTPFNCAEIESSNLAGATVVGAFPSLHLLLGADTTAVFQFQCN